MSVPGNVLLDSNIVIAHFRREETASEKLAAAGVLYLSTISLGELQYGARKSHNPENKLAQLRAFMSQVVVLPVEQTTAVSYGEIKMALSRAGTPIPDNDVWIAAAAQEHRLPLATRDQHFDHVAGLTVLHW